MVISLNSIAELQEGYSVVLRRRVHGSNNKSRYRLESSLTVVLSNGRHIYIPKGFEWDLSSVPRFLWWLLPPDGDFELAALIHDYLYVVKQGWCDRKFADSEMLLWSKVVSGTNSKWSFRNFDNWIRYFAVRVFGGFVWSGKIKV